MTDHGSLAPLVPGRPEVGGGSEYRDRLLSLVGGYERFERTFHQRTHSPDRRARIQLDDGEAMWKRGEESVRAASGDDALVATWTERFLRKWVAYQSAGSRVLNWMITGPARFPVARNQKRMDTEQKRLDELCAHVDGAGQWTARQIRLAARAQVSADAKASGVEHREKAFDGGKIVLNKALDRVQLVFDDKPDPETIAALKGRAFRWSPREGAWQRQLTQNGIWAAEAIAKASGATA